MATDAVIRPDAQTAGTVNLRAFYGTSFGTAWVVPSDQETVERALRHRVFWQEVAEAQAEHQRGESVVFRDAEALIRDLGLEEAVAKPRRPRRRHPRQPEVL